MLLLPPVFVIGGGRTDILAKIPNLVSFLLKSMMNSFEYVQNVQGGRRSDVGDITTAAVVTRPVPPQPITPSGGGRKFI